MVESYVFSLLEPLLRLENIKICELNFKFGNRIVDVLGLDGEKNPCFIFTSDRDVNASQLTKISVELTRYVRTLEPFLDLFQKEMFIRIFLAMPSKFLNVGDHYFIPKSREQSKGNFIRKSKGPFTIKPTIGSGLSFPIRRMEKPSRQRSHTYLVRFVYDNLGSIWPSLFEDDLKEYEIAQDELIESPNGTRPADIILKRGNKIMKILEIESPLPRDPFLRDMRIESLMRELSIYKSVVGASNVVVITQYIESDIEEISIRLSMKYLAIDTL